MEIIILRGLPRSGKSTRATGLVKAYVARKQYPCLIDKDSIRKMYHEMGEYQWPFDGKLEEMIHLTALQQLRYANTIGQETVIWDDAIDGLTDADVRNLKHSIEQVVPNATFHEESLDTSPEECIRRAVATNQAYLVPVIMSMAVQRMYASLPDNADPNKALRGIVDITCMKLQEQSTEIQKCMRDVCSTSETDDA